MTITENLTGVVKEEPKTITEFFDEIKATSVIAIASIQAK